MSCVSELVLETREFEMLLGQINLDGSRKVEILAGVPFSEHPLKIGVMLQHPVKSRKNHTTDTGMQSERGFSKNGTPNYLWLLHNFVRG